MGGAYIAHLEMYSFSPDDIRGQYIDSRALLILQPSIPMCVAWNLNIITVHSAVGITTTDPLKTSLS